MEKAPKKYPSLKEVAPVTLITDKDFMKEEAYKEEENQEDMSIAHRVKSRKLSKLSPSISISFNCNYSDCETESNMSVFDEEHEGNPNDPFIDKIISLVYRIAPDLCYSKAKSDARRKKQLRKERRKVTRSVHPDLRCLWRHVDALLAPPAPRVQQVSPYPRVDWTKVNVRNLANLPKTQNFAVHGCAEDPNFFEKRIVDMGGGIKRYRSPFEDGGCFPYGHLPGYLTQVGIISPGSHGDVVSGHTWSSEEGGWVLHANQPRAREKPANNKKLYRKDPEVEFQKKPRRKKVQHQSELNMIHKNTFN